MSRRVADVPVGINLTVARSLRNIADIGPLVNS